MNFKKFTDAFDKLDLNFGGGKKNEVPLQPQQRPYGQSPQPYPSGHYGNPPNQSYAAPPPTPAGPHWNSPYAHVHTSAPRPPSDNSRPPPGPSGDYNRAAPPPPSDSYGSQPLPQYQPPSDKPPLPAGWLPYWDSRAERWYYVNAQLNRTQWEAPGFEPNAHGSDFREQVQHGQGGYGAGAPPPSGYAPSGFCAPGGNPHGGSEQQPQQQQQKKKSSSGVLLGAAGGLAVGAVGGALIAGALDRSDNEACKEGDDALEAATSSSTSSSERDELQEAQDDYEEAQEAYQEADFDD